MKLKTLLNSCVQLVICKKFCSDENTITISNMEQIKLVIAGHIDHGKSTMIGRIMQDIGALHDDKIELLKAISKRRGMPMEWAFVLDAMRTEREQGITIQTTQVFLKTPTKSYAVIDVPGHKEFLNNMISGAASADAAILVVDAKEGVQDQTRVHSYILRWLGFDSVLVTINKMDLVNYSKERFDELRFQVNKHLKKVGIISTTILPVSARYGDGLVHRSQNMSWFTGPTLMSSLDAFWPKPMPMELPLRLPIQDIYKFDERRIIAGRIESGKLKVGDTLMFAPNNSTAKVRSIEAWGVKLPVLAASAGQCVGITLEDHIFVERGFLASHKTNPPVQTYFFRARIFWLANTPLELGRYYKLKLTTIERIVEVFKIEKVIDIFDLSEHSGNQIERNMIGEVVLHTRAMLYLDEFTFNPHLGRFVLFDGYDMVAGGLVFIDKVQELGLISYKSLQQIPSVEDHVTIENRWRANGHKSGVLWLTGLSGSGKSTLALELENILFRKGWQVCVLDGDNIRSGLSADLGYSPSDRHENIRRVGEIARLFANSGVLVITAFISPYRSDRARARALMPSLFHEIYVNASLDSCKKRDPKGLYKKANNGEIIEFTGISSPYEVPSSPEVEVNTCKQSINQSIEKMLSYIQAKFALENNE
ncbi:adenylylsulfate kinase [Candidatus Endolissoclinum faulkneri L2]|uniref:Adenylyl-sulfate kinase n=1 Tax=Candidatus Endolissoclinum faulkneri L2 TaxID=1193729 RepID=K7Z5X1_9PROT|nr:adenylyl-sulfate kinase [Candidatus Endolissoclinum faulkneri]AFX99493.1 adenylylsulfate kinase [Candidatus Endolissoclinum faulkneri L2]